MTRAKPPPPEIAFVDVLQQWLLPCLTKAFQTIETPPPPKRKKKRAA